MQIFITGATGFLGKNLIRRLQEIPSVSILTFDRQENLTQLNSKIKNADFIFHLAAVHRPIDPIEFVNVNQDLTRNILESLRYVDNHSPVLYTSSAQALDDTDYGRSKMVAETLLIEHSQRLRSQVIIMRLNNVFGRWAQPNHHSVVATWCYNIARGIPIRIDNPNCIMKLCYVDDVIDQFLASIFGEVSKRGGYMEVNEGLIYEIALKDIASTLYAIYENRFRLDVDDPKYSVKVKLLSTYLSYVP